MDFHISNYPQETSSSPTSSLPTEGGEEEEAVPNMSENQQEDKRASSTDDAASDNVDDNLSVLSFSSCGTVGLANSQLIIETKVMPIYEEKNVCDKQESLDQFTE